MRRYTAVIHQEGAWFVADCPEVGTVSQGRTAEEAFENLKEATALYLEEAGDDVPLARAQVRDFQLA
ncbi:MAG: type II toxin-antitoxin system HicB family antitoxin [Candidatus Latescibacterota bacterium]